MFDGEAETLGCVPGRRYVVCPTPQGTVPTATLLDNIVDRAATHGASRIYLAHARRRGLRGRAVNTVGESGGAGLRRADGVDGHERRL